MLPTLPNFASHVRHLICDLERDRLNSVTIAMNQIAGPDLQASHFDLAAEIENVRVGVRYRNIAGEHLKFRRPDVGQVSYRAVCDNSYAAQREKYVRVDLSYERA